MAAVVVGRKKIVLMDPFVSAAEVRDALGKYRDQFDIVATDRVPSGDDIFALMVGPESPVSADEITALSALSIVVVTSTGFDHIPIDAATGLGAWVATTAGYCTEEVAEHAVALLLCGLRGIPALNSSVRAGNWDVIAVAPRRISGAVVGLLGFGRIAQSVARRLTMLGVGVKAFDPFASGEAFDRLGVQRTDSLIDAITEADAISLHIPSTPETRNVIDANCLALLAPGTFVVNVARGELIDLSALAEAIANGQVSGAGLDVFVEEPLPMDAPIRGVPNVLLGPHGAWYSVDAEQRLVTSAVDSILDVLEGRPPAGAIAAPDSLAGPILPARLSTSRGHPS